MSLSPEWVAIARTCSLSYTLACLSASLHGIRQHEEAGTMLVDVPALEF
jgi:hypothetical protein